MYKRIHVFRCLHKKCCNVISVDISCLDMNMGGRKKSPTAAKVNLLNRKKTKASEAAVQAF